MTDQKNSERLIEAILTGLFESSVSRQQRIDGLLNRFDVLEAGKVDLRPEKEPSTANFRVAKDEHSRISSRRSISTRRITMFTTACGLLLAVGVVTFMVGTPTAEASLARVINAARQGVVRTYDLEVSGRRRQTIFRRRMVLHSRSTDSFAIEMTDAPVQPMVLGIDDQGAWAVTGNRVRRASDDEDSLPMEGFFLNRITVRMLNLNRMLTEIPGNYKLRLGEPEPIPGLEGRLARPVVATLSQPIFRLPRSITIWPDSDTGLALRMEIELPPVRGVRGLNSITAVYRGEESDSDEAIAPEAFQSRPR